MKNSVEQAIEEIGKGKFIVVIDDKGAAKAGYLVVAADKVTPDAMAFLMRSCAGVVSMCVPRATLERLEIPDLPFGATYGASVDYRHGRKTGVTATEKYRTVRALITPEVHAGDFRRPGNIYPVSYAKGGILMYGRPGEAAVDLARLSGGLEAAVFGQVAGEDGAAAGMEALQKFVKQQQMTVVTFSDLSLYRWNHEKLVRELSRARIPSEYGEFEMALFGTSIDDIEHVALVKGKIKEGDEVLVRIHSECLTGDIFASKRCDCGPQLHRAMQMVSEAGKGVVIYLRGHEGRGIGLAHKLRAYCLQDKGQDTVEANITLGFPADKRDYGIAAQILKTLGAKKVKILTNNPKKTLSLQKYGIEVTEREALECETNPENLFYLQTKKKKLGHILDL